jgi:hypothetical protein
MKILFFYERFWDNILKFSRRRGDEVSRWAKRYGMESDFSVDISSKKLLDRAQRSGDRYTAVNLTNRETIEFRIFKGTLNHVTIMATLQFCHELVEFCKTNTLSHISSVTWGEFVSSITEYKELTAYLTQKKLNTSDTPTVEKVVGVAYTTSYDEAECEDDDDLVYTMSYDY